MKILKSEPGIIVLEQYGRTYLRFMAGGICDKLYQVEISNKELEMIMNASASAESVVNHHMNIDPDLPDGLEDKTITDCLPFSTSLSDKEKQDMMDALHRHRDIWNEFYFFVLMEEFEEDGITEQGYCASRLAEEFSMSPAEAYRCLVSLREAPKGTAARLRERQASA